MAIPKGSFVRLSPKGVGAVKTYCVDPHLKAPKPGLSYSRVAANDAQAVVTVGNRQMTLQKAIQDGVVSVRGRKPQFEDFLRYYQQATGVSPEPYRDELRKLFDTRFRDAHDHTSLELESHSSEEVTIKFGETSLLTTESDRASTSISPLLSILGDSTSKATQGELQTAFWRARALNHIESLGYKVNSGDVEEVKRFQKDYGLSVTGKNDNGTVKAGTRALSLEEIRPRDSGAARIAEIRFEHPRLGRPKLYTVYDQAGRQIIATDDLSQVVTKLYELHRPEFPVKSIRKADSSELYIDAIGFTADERVALVSSLQGARHEGIHFVTRREAGYPHPFFTRGQTQLVTAEPKIKAIVGEKYGFEADVDLDVHSERVSLAILGKTHEVVGDAITEIKKPFGKKTVTTMSVCELVANCKKELKAAKKLTTDEELQFRLKETLENFQTVDSFQIRFRRKAS